MRSVEFEVSMVHIIYFAFVAGFMCDTLAATVENPFKRCNTKEDNFEKCLAQAIQEAIVSLRDGNRNLGMIPLEAIKVPSLIVPGRGSVKVDQVYKNITIHKVSHGFVKKASWNKSDKMITFEYFIPEGYFDFDYDMSGKILLLPLEGKGHGSIKIYNTTTIHQLKYEEKENKDQEKVIKIIDYKIQIIPKLVHYDLRNLFNGNKELGDGLLNVMNEQWEPIFNEIKEGYEQWFASIFLSFAKRIFSKIPEKNIFIE